MPQFKALPDPAQEGIPIAISIPDPAQGYRPNPELPMTQTSKPSRAFEPYVPPNEEAGPLTVDKDLCWRLNPQGLVTPAVIGAISWARNHFRMSAQDHRAILDGLGLEYFDTGLGGIVLRPQEAWRVQPQSAPKPRPLNLSNPSLELKAYDAIEVYPCIQTEEGIERFEANEHSATAAADFWSVALHLETGGIETIADFPLESQAEVFGELMRGLVLAQRQTAGLDTRHLMACCPASKPSH